MWGLLGVLATAVCYGLGTVLQAVAARRTARTSGVDVRMFRSLLSQTPYLASLVVDAAGFLASIVALRSLPLFLVESAVASSVGVTAVFAVWFLGARLGRVEIGALGALGVGLVLLAVSAEPGPGRPLAASQQWVLLAGVVVLLILGVGATRLPDRWACAGLAAAAGASFGGVGIAARTLVVPQPLWQLLLEPLAWAIVGYGGLALLLFAMSLQRGPVTTTAAVTVSAETLLPAILGVLVLGDASRPGFAGLAVAGFALTLLGAVALARFAEPEPESGTRPAR